MFSNRVELLDQKKESIIDRRKLRGEIKMLVGNMDKSLAVELIICILVFLLLLNIDDCYSSL